ncbi:cupredoxin domain-containing protein [Cohnella faecalis]|uniref:Cytochrome C oxidase subunit II n=1 Tax=Cohnella faecalis TaxID=2315694 RepID=A0A398CWA1_9BACL|nr:cupredoxin domain-containing protein [Cohnella faecalis]RIE04097.1 cytochrome C oxidase subunit II [Cohnella faecalis]
MKSKLFLFLTIIALAFALAACGSKKENSGASPSSAETPVAASAEVVIKAQSWEFDKAEYEVPANTPVKITIENTKGAHGIKVDGTDIDIGPGKESQVVTLEPGTYDFSCSIMCGSGHRKMVGKLIVK